MTLCIETSTSRGSIALLDAGDCLLVRDFASERSHNSQIFAPLGEALELGRPDLIVVGTGPGSYTGTRIGIAAAIGISLTHGARLIGLPSVCAAEIDDPESAYHLVGDARRSSFFYAQVRARRLVREPELIDRSQLDRLRLQEDLQLVTFDPTPPADGILCTFPTAAILGEIAFSLIETEIDALAASPVVPHYMSAPFVTSPKKKSRGEAGGKAPG